MSPTQSQTQDLPKIQDSMFDKVMQRPEDYETLSWGHKWAIDEELGITEWSGDCDHNELVMCPSCRRKWRARFRNSN